MERDPTPTGKGDGKSKGTAMLNISLRLMLRIRLRTRPTTRGETRLKLTLLIATEQAPQGVEFSTSDHLKSETSARARLSVRQSHP